MTPTQCAAMAYKIVRSDLGRRAADEGWINELWDHVFRTGREPDEAEQNAMREAADAKWAELPDWPFASARQAITNKYERLRRAAYEHE